MARILTGIQSSGRPHLGNLLGAIIPAIELSQKPGNESFFFIADLHSLTSIKDAETRVHNVRAMADVVRVADRVRAAAMDGGPKRT